MKTMAIREIGDYIIFPKPPTAEEISEASELLLRGMANDLAKAERIMRVNTYLKSIRAAYDKEDRICPSDPLAMDPNVQIPPDLGDGWTYAIKVHIMTKTETGGMEHELKEGAEPFGKVWPANG